MLPKLKIEDLKLGMRVHVEQLSETRDIWILLEKKNPTDKVGTIRFIGKIPNKSSQALLNTGKPISCIYHDSELLDGEEMFDEFE